MEKAPVISGTIRQLSSTGQMTYDSHVRSFNRWNGGHPVTVDSIRNFLREASEQYAPATVASMKAGLKKAIRSGVHDARLIAALDAAFREIKTPKADRKVYREEVLSDEETARLVEDSPEWTGLIIRTLALTGLRISELTGIRLADCRQDGKTVFVRILGKGKKERRVFLQESLFNRIRETFTGKTFLFENRRGNPYCRKFLWREIQKHGLRSIDRPIHPHSFRHSFATNQIRRRGSVKAVSLYLGHSSTAITEGMYHHDEILPEDLF